MAVTRRSGRLAQDDPSQSSPDLDPAPSTIQEKSNLRADVQDLIATKLSEMIRRGLGVHPRLKQFSTKQAVLDRLNLQVTGIEDVVQDMSLSPAPPKDTAFMQQLTRKSEENEIGAYRWQGVQAGSPTVMYCGTGTSKKGIRDRIQSHENSHHVKPRLVQQAMERGYNFSSGPGIIAWGPKPSEDDLEEWRTFWLALETFVAWVLGCVHPFAAGKLCYKTGVRYVGEEGVFSDDWTEAQQDMAED